VDTLQTWIVIGVPALLLALSLLVGRSNGRAFAAYGVLLVATLSFVIIPGDPLSAAACGMLAFALVAVGRGQDDDEHPEHHEDRRRFTVARR
jgi:drug/metabolite transporter superfamily protein YnfA